VRRLAPAFAPLLAPAGLAVWPPTRLHWSWCAWSVPLSRSVIPSVPEGAQPALVSGTERPASSLGRLAVGATGQSWRDTPARCGGGMAAKSMGLAGPTGSPKVFYRGAEARLPTGDQAGPTAPRRIASDPLRARWLRRYCPARLIPTALVVQRASGILESARRLSIRAEQFDREHRGLLNGKQENFSLSSQDPRHAVRALASR